MIRVVHCILLAAAGLCAGCLAVALPGPASPARTTFVVPGVFGDGPWYDGLRAAVDENGTTVMTVAWGRSKPLFFANFSGRRVHEIAETRLAAAIDAADGPVDLVGHSAGCGVILGALRLVHRDVGRVVLIAPSVSPAYDLSAALGRAERIDCFYSDRDTVFLKWRCGTFGTYDAIKTPAAGYCGFARANAKLVQHPYDPAWAAYGNRGGHSGGTGAAFARAVIAPLLAR